MTSSFLPYFNMSFKLPTCTPLTSTQRVYSLALFSPAPASIARGVSEAEMNFLTAATLRARLSSLSVAPSSTRNLKHHEDLEDARTGNADTGYNLRHVEATYIGVGLDSHHALWD